MISVPFLDLVASDHFSNQHSAGFDRLVVTQGDRIFSEIAHVYPAYLFSEFNLFYQTERRLALVENPDAYIEWFSSRIKLFEEVCLPSYSDLVIKPSAWFLLCDTPQDKREEILLEKLSSMSSLFSVATADFRPASSDLERHYYLKPNLIRKCISSAWTSNSASSSAVITSRLDTDDAIGRLYFYNLYKYIHLSAGSAGFSGNDFVANFPNGAQVLSTPVGLASGTAFTASSLVFGENCFTSRVEYTSDPSLLETVWSCPHDQVFGKLPVRNLVTQSPSWYQLIHGRNVQNQAAASCFSLHDFYVPQYLKDYFSGHWPLGR